MKTKILLFSKASVATLHAVISKAMFYIPVRKR